MRSLPLYRAILGESFDTLSPALRELHDGDGARRARGRARVVRSRHVLGWLIARCMSFPPNCDDTPVAVEMVPDGRGERWTRDFGGHRFSSRVCASGDRLVEVFGPAAFFFRLEATQREIYWRFSGMRVLGIPWPRALAPSITARERDDRGYRFEVRVTLPGIGTLVEYEGSLVPSPADDPDGAVVVFDGVCVLCSAWVRFLLKRDREAELRFASVQSIAGGALLQRCGESAADPQTLLFIEEGRCYKQTDAIRRILGKLSLPWRLAALTLGLIPRVLRDWVYLRIARNRYRLFGKRETCLMPDLAVKERFLE